ncbi:NnrU family protein [Algiphilus sp.]|uniref:NnrU family protein n=1 Tax=Algiphilus sp. TaxID=1872431 RepID=UPI003B51F9C2
MLLSLGIVLWAVTHLFVAVAPSARQHLVDTLGLGPYKGLFSLVIVLSLVIIVLGWQAMPPTSAYVPPIGLRHATLLLVPIAVVLFISARAPTDIKRIIRHPQLTGVKLWAVAHLLANGEWRSLILFGGFLAWAVLEVIFIKRRDGAWVKPEPVGAVRTTVSAIIGLVLAALLIVVHPWIAGRPVIAMG